MQIIKESQCIDGNFREYRLGVNLEDKTVRWIPEFSLAPSHDFESYKEVTEILEEFENKVFFIPCIKSDDMHVYLADSVGDKTLRYLGTIKE